VENVERLGFVGDRLSSFLAERRCRCRPGDDSIPLVEGTVNQLQALGVFDASTSRDKRRIENRCGIFCAAQKSEPWQSSLSMKIPPIWLRSRARGLNFEIETETIIDGQKYAITIEPAGPPLNAVD